MVGTILYALYVMLVSGATTDEVYEAGYNDQQIEQVQRQIDSEKGIRRELQEIGN
ncbi:hypothetical protein [Winogradskyella sp. J14-2]|uniref:hypothetical protein n=1 Tax=Winogradskyella sp. J14-2 TaxID=1936080 RepID=UPI0012F854E1|nr:hypothetical protein [Winogradskyella sp. J14-2]